MPDTPDDFFALPAFKPAEALLQLQRHLRDQRGLVARGTGFEWQGRPAIELALDESIVTARLCRKPSRTPTWEAHRLGSAADVRRFKDVVQQCLRRWVDED